MDQRIAQSFAEEQEANPGKSLTSELDADTLRSIMVANDNSEGLFTPVPEVDEDGEPKQIREEVDEEVKVETGKVTNKYGDYIKAFQDDMVNNPGRYTIQTPEGEMSIKDALAQGYDPATQSFGKPEVEANMEEELAGLPPEEAEAIKAMTNPARGEEAPPTAEQMLPPGAGGPQAQPQPGQPQPGPEAEAGILAALGGGQ